MIHKQLENATYGASTGLTLGGWVLEHLPTPDVLASIASLVGMLTGIGMFAVTCYFKWKNSNNYEKALNRGVVEEPSNEE